MDKLMRQNVQLSNIEITDGNIKSFERVAKKYSIDFSLKKDTTAKPPRYFVFFKARDADVMTAAFKEYTGKSLNKTKKPSVRTKLKDAITQAKDKNREREKTKQKEKEPTLRTDFRRCVKYARGIWRESRHCLCKAFNGELTG